MDEKVFASFMGGILGAAVGSILKGMWDRRLAKKEPKTEKRAKAYEDFVVYFMTGGAHTTDSPPTLNEIKARLVVFGESEVVNKASNFLKNYSSLKSDEAREAFCGVVAAMRESVKTGAGNEVVTNIQNLLKTDNAETSTS